MECWILTDLGFACSLYKVLSDPEQIVFSQPQFSICEVRTMVRNHGVLEPIQVS